MPYRRLINIGGKLNFAFSANPGILRKNPCLIVVALTGFQKFSRKMIDNSARNVTLSKSDFFLLFSRDSMEVAMIARRMNSQASCA